MLYDDMRFNDLECIISNVLEFEKKDDNSDDGAKMTCKGTMGTAKKVNGINDCLV